MKKILLSLVFALAFLSPAHASEDIVYYEDYDLDEAVGLKEKTQDQVEEIPASKDENQDLGQKNFTKAKVVSVTDGDTVTAEIDSKNNKIRMIGVDTPETVHPSKPLAFYGKEASDFTKAILNNREVYLERDVSEADKYNRSLRYIWLSLPANPKNPSFEDVRDKMYNAILLRDGYGRLSTFPPDVKYQDYFKKIARQAEKNELGLYNQAAKSSFEGEEYQPENKYKKPSPPKSSESKKPNYIGDGDLPIEGQKVARVYTKKGSYLADVTPWPIKANMSSGIYHSPGQRDYNKISIDNVTWFSSAKVAENAGYTPAKR